MVSRSPHSFVVRAKWTAVDPHDGAKHFVVVGCTEEQVELRCVVGDQRLVVGKVELSDPKRWATGWR